MARSCGPFRYNRLCARLKADPPFGILNQPMRVRRGVPSSRSASEKHQVAEAQAKGVLQVQPACHRRASMGKATLCSRLGKRRPVRPFFARYGTRKSVRVVFRAHSRRNTRRFYLICRLNLRRRGTATGIPCQTSHFLASGAFFFQSTSRTRRLYVQEELVLPESTIKAISTNGG